AGALELAQVGLHSGGEDEGGGEFAVHDGESFRSGSKTSAGMACVCAVGLFSALVSRRLFACRPIDEQQMVRIGQQTSSTCRDRLFRG
ncbi:MAG: hypothetical protein H7322_06410, partial [Ramlibacter sp.]|nr:hypothetical protein [Ramlibacter sp.]